MQVGLVQQGLAGFRAAFAQNEREVLTVEFSEARCHIGYVEQSGMGGNDLLKSTPDVRIT
jgi:hypothetical protein